jgi:LysR family cys regulon transcriptional activator
MYDFIQSFAPHLTRERVDAAIAAHAQGAMEKVFEGVTLPSA